MSMSFKVRRNGEYVKTGVIPTNHSDETRFGWIDAAIIAFFLIGVGALFFLLGQVG
jgi:hypothetical protein